MNPTSVIEERVVFGRNVDPEVNACLQEAVSCAHDFERSKELFYKARSMQPDQLEVYIALYKFCFYRGHFDEAEDVAMDALKQAAKRGGFSHDWVELNRESTDWEINDGPQRVYLYSLKALAFISLRKGLYERANNILEKLKQLDVDDLVGSSVISDLAEAVQE